jgi:hypothetical protein
MEHMNNEIYTETREYIPQGHELTNTEQKDGRMAR